MSPPTPADDAGAVEDGAGSTTSAGRCRAAPRPSRAMPEREAALVEAEATDSELDDGDASEATADARRRRRGRPRCRPGRRRGGRRRSPPRGGGGRARDQPLRPARALVRGAHAVGLREQGPPEPRGPHRFDEHGGPHPRGGHPHRGRRRVQGRPQGRRPAQGVPRLPARALRPRRRLLVRHPQHPRRHRLRRARATSPRRCPGATSRPSWPCARAASSRPSGASPASSTS